MSRDWTHRQLVFAANELCRAAKQIEIALKHRADGSEDIATGLRVRFAHATAANALLELRRADRRLNRATDRSAKVVQPTAEEVGKPSREKEPSD